MELRSEIRVVRGNCRGSEAILRDTQLQDKRLVYSWKTTWEDRVHCFPLGNGMVLIKNKTERKETLHGTGDA